MKICGSHFVLSGDFNPIAVVEVRVKDSRGKTLHINSSHPREVKMGGRTPGQLRATRVKNPLPNLEGGLPGYTSFVTLKVNFSKLRGFASRIGVTAPAPPKEVNENEMMDKAEEEDTMILSGDGDAMEDPGGQDTKIPLSSLAPTDASPASPVGAAHGALSQVAAVSSLPPPAPNGPRGRRAQVTKAAAAKSTSISRSRLHSPAHRQKRNAKSILKPGPSSSPIRKTRQTKVSATKSKTKSVTLDPEPQIQQLNSSVYRNSDEENEPPVPSSDDDPTPLNRSPPDHGHGHDHDSESEMTDIPPPGQPQRPSLKLKLSKPVVPQAGGVQSVQTPVPTSGTRTPSLKLKFATTPGASPASVPRPKKEEKAKKEEKTKKGTDTITVTPSSSSKKRKRPSNAHESDDETAKPAKPPVIRKITLKQSSQPTPAPLAPPATKLTQTFTLKTKGKAPKRPLGVGYDSELETDVADKDTNQKPTDPWLREVDPVIHEGFVLRMQPGPDCDYLQKAIQDGTAGLHPSKGGAFISLRMLDTLGRRGVLKIKDNQYATSLVDLPCIVEGMKSWDRKGWIKSVDICQMLLVLGRCSNDDQARNYALPEDVDPNTFQYAHGLTAPMKWVRKRRFARTKRARVDDIEAVERRVHQLLEADKAATSSRYQLLDHDPRLDEERYSSGLEDEDEDAEGEEDIPVTQDSYFDIRPVQNGGVVETPMYTETPVAVHAEIDQEDVDEFARMFGDDDEVPAAQTASQARNTLHIPEVGDSSFAVTSTSASPSITVAHTPASAAGATSDEDDDDDGGDEDEDLDDAEKEGDENLQQVKDRIEDMQQKIAEQTEVLKKTQNAILKKKLARKIQDLKDDVAMMKKNAGLAGDEDDD